MRCDSIRLREQSLCKVKPYKRCRIVPRSSFSFPWQKSLRQAFGWPFRKLFRLSRRNTITSCFLIPTSFRKRKIRRETRFHALFQITCFLWNLIYRFEFHFKIPRSLDHRAARLQSSTFWHFTVTSATCNNPQSLVLSYSIILISRFPSNTV